MKMQPKIIVGLGNPGETYTHTYHNVGFSFLDFIYGDNMPWGNSKLFRKITKSGVLLVKPNTYMNESGKAVALLLRKQGCKPHELLVVHDDHDLPLGSYKIANPGQGSAGHKGVQSIIDAIGATFPRLRIGISKTPPGVPHRKAGETVLRTITKDDERLLENVFQEILRTHPIGES